ncbi:MAG: hypothetical protein J0651_03595, partial [Actinobacteria bacterium]|nr:hypothetical protein [Actinomycetota bacterium]
KVQIVRVIGSAAFAGTVNNPAVTASATIAPRNAFLVVNFFMYGTLQLKRPDIWQAKDKTLRTLRITHAIGVAIT